MAQNLFRTVQRLLDDAGALEPNATIEVYVAGTTTPLQLYSDRGLTNTAGYSVTTDARGVPPERWIADNVKFKFVYKDAGGAVKDTRDYANEDLNNFGEGWDEILDDTVYDAVRIKLTADTTFYVNHAGAVVDINGAVWAAGSNANDGLTRTAPFATVTYAYKRIRDRYDCNGKKVIIQVVPRTFNEYVVCHGPCVGLQSETSGAGIAPEGSMGIVIRGDLVTDGAAYNSRSDANPCFSFGYGARVRLEGVKYGNATCTDSILKVSENSLVDLGQVIVGACGGPGMQAANARIRGRASGDSSGWVKWDGNAPIGIVVEVGNGQADFVDVRFGAAVTFSGVATSAWANVGEGSYLGLLITTSFTGTFTGRKYYMSDFSVGSTVEDLERIPGSLEGVWTSPNLTEPQCRLTLENNVPVSITDQTAKTTLYYEPHVGDYACVSVNNAAAYEMVTIGTSGISLALDNNAGHTGYHQADKNFDVFLFRQVDATVSLGTGPAWTDATTRSADVSRVNGIFANTNAMTVRFGTANGDTKALNAGEGVYIGTIRTTGTNGQVEDSMAKRYVWNAYQRVPRPMRVLEATDTWTYSTAAWQQANASATNQLDMVRGFDIDVVSAFVSVEVSHSSATPVPARVAIGIDAAAVATGCVVGAMGADSGSFRSVTSRYSGYPGIGRRALKWLEWGPGSATATWRGDAGVTQVQGGIVGEVVA